MTIHDCAKGDPLVIARGVAAYICPTVTLEEVVILLIAAPSGPSVPSVERARDALAQVALLNEFELSARFVLLSSISRPLTASVFGS